MTNSMPEPGDAPNEYVAYMLDLLGERAPLDVLPQTPNELRQRIASFPDAILRKPEKPGKWSILQVLTHMADTDLVYNHRIRKIVAQDRPAIHGYDHNRWAERFTFEDLTASEEVDRFAAQRKMTLRFFELLEPSDWERVGVHSERGEESVELISKLIAAHDLAHLRQIDRIASTLQDE